MPLIPDFITPQVVLIFITFILVVFILYKLFKVLFKATLVTIAAFSFPWIVKALGLPFPIAADVQTGIYFALAGLGLFLIYEFFHFAVYILKIIAWPVRALLGMEKHGEEKRMDEEMKKIKEEENGE